MRVVQYIDTLSSGGKERQLIELLKGLIAEPDMECELITMSEEIHYTYLNELDIKTHLLLRYSKKDPLIFYRLYQLLKQIQPDILHSWSAMCSVYAVPIVKLQGVKFVNGFLRNAPPNLSANDKEWIRSKLTFPFSDAIVSNSRAGLAAYQAPLHKSFCIHNGFDFKRLRNLPSQENVRKKYNIITEHVVGMVATFSDKKDFATYLTAAQKILATRDDVTFVAVGDGKNLEPLQKQIPINLKDRIRFLGKQKQVEEIVNIFTVGVLATNAKIHGEGISNTIMEYMALGKPVVATDCGGNRELIDEGKTGYLVKYGATGQLIRKISSLLDNKQMAGQFGEAATRRLKEQFNLGKMTTAHVKLYNELVSR